MVETAGSIVGLKKNRDCMNTMDFEGEIFSLMIMLIFDTFKSTSGYRLNSSERNWPHQNKLTAPGDWLHCNGDLLYRENG